MAKIAIVGSRGYRHMQKVIDYIKTLPMDTIIVSGGANGVDSVAEECARRIGLQVEIYRANWNKFGKSAGMIRNGDIVAASDKVVAFWDEKSRGTADSIRKARAARKPLTIFNAEGIANE